MSHEPISFGPILNTRLGGGMQLTGSTIYFVRSWTRVMRAMPTLSKLRQHRKDPARMLELIGCESGMSVERIASALSKRLGITVAIRVSPHARLGMDVDKPSDLQMAIQLLG